MTKSIKRMKRLFAWGTALLLVGGMQAALLPVDEPITPVDYVSTLVGTQSKHALSTGNTYPAVAMPWGMNFWTPQTGTMGDGWAYTYDADKIRGFKQTHQPSPWINDYGQFAIMPITGKVAFDQDERASWFSHKAETATPYYYKVYLADHDVTAEFAPTERAAAFRFTFPETEEAYVVVDAMDNGSFVKIIPAEKKIIGYTTKNSGGVPSNFKNYFVLQFDKPFTYTAAVKDGKIAPRTTEASANHAGGIIGFHTLRGEQVNVRVASSFISHEQAELNLKELGDRTLEEVAKAGRDEWNRVLGRIEVQDTDLDRLRTFYSCFYRSVLFPRSFYEIDAQGQVMHYSPYNGEVLPGYMFTDTGFWDTFRCLFPFLNLMYPSMNAKMQEGLANTYKESGFLPEWASPGHRGCMVGNNSASVVADAWLKGLRGYDIETLWNAVKSGTENVHPEVSSTGRLVHEYYNKLGYVPYNVGINDSFNQMMDSVFVLPPVFDESYYGSVIHEIREMQIMNMGNYAHGNQPIQHMIYLYNYSSQPWKAQYWLREVMERMYSAYPDGYCGDEDNGQTSAWYVFSALGFYPVCPGTDQYVLGAPLFRSVRLHLENGKTVTIEAPENSRANRYVQKLTVDGVDYTRNFLTHEQLTNGSSLRFTMDNVPNKLRGTGEEDAPYSFSKTLKKKK